MRTEFDNITLGMLQRCVPSETMLTAKRGPAWQGNGPGDPRAHTAAEALDNLVELARRTGRLKIADNAIVEYFPFPDGDSVIRVHRRGQETYSVFAPNEEETMKILSTLEEEHGGWL